MPLEWNRGHLVFVLSVCVCLSMCLSLYFVADGGILVLQSHLLYIKIKERYDIM